MLVAILYETSKMKNYFGLQHKMLNRQMTDFGINPVFAYLLLLLAFIGLSIFLFKKTSFAEYIYILMAVSLISRLTETNRNDFLKSCFQDSFYYIIRIIENLIFALPFLIFLTYKSCFLSASVLLLLSGVFAFVSFENKFHFTMPTPFYKQPFEFIIGFRKVFWGFLASYLLTFISISVHNFNLGIFSLLLAFLLCISFYTHTETPFYVWIYSLTPKLFLLKKTKTALLHSTLLCLPIAVNLSLFYSANIYIVFGFCCLGYVFLISIVFAKYSAFPDKMNLPQTILLAISILFPPLLLIFIPYFYIQSIKKLNTILR